ncbi:MAG: TIGR03936 family radical SAM-associated protein [Lachnospiraceae bacterium]|nr:TIGR03936 family radical SAM-associated protein [Lachnospiraceae bacterium]
MNVRVKFRKYGNLRFIGHLDTMRYFQKAIRRAGLDVCYSEGFTPHMIMSFAQPLGVGLESDGEYMDIRVNSTPSSAEAVRLLNENGAEGIEVLSWRELPEGSKNAMSIVAAANYEVRFREGCEPPEGWEERLLMFLQKPEILVQKETKKRAVQEVDIRPWVYACAVREGVIFLTVSTGSVGNLKPELLLQAFAEQEGYELQRFGLLLRRKELYADLGTDGERKLVPLEKLGAEIG